MKDKFIIEEADGKMGFQSMEDLIDYAVSQNLHEFSAGETLKDLKKFAIGEFFYKDIEHMFIVYSIPGEPIVIKDVQEFDCVINPFLKKIVFDKDAHMRIVSASIHSESSRKMVSDSHPLIRLITECINEGKELIEIYKNEGGEWIAIGTKQDNSITFHTGRIAKEGEKIEFAYRRINYEDVSWVFDPTDVRFFW